MWHDQPRSSKIGKETRQQKDWRRQGRGGWIKFAKKEGVCNIGEVFIK